MRITVWWGKLLYIVVGYGAGWVFSTMLKTTGNGFLQPLIVLLFNAVLVWGGGRIFRVAGEARTPRPWWKMTGRPRLSRALRNVFGVLAGIEILTAIGMLVIPNSFTDPAAVASALTWAAAEYAMVCAFYAISVAHFRNAAVAPVKTFAVPAAFERRKPITSPVAQPHTITSAVERRKAATTPKE